ncbi:hypothetical protein E0W68_13455 [Flavobacterium salilacus subsp. salilacus]|uniref:hypothetical protein n=1 Tax=Flavobacterium TaxID=237 RepID=UPI001074E191|nr:MULTISPECIES: hypothetical protein [Flavobacterium]KAF2514833.1 hypothetical protein E0W68_13455 [Flavobacterium salilacus subsp. salilacus]MBE1615443.1 hypothetical protein [Flavobacterium sp. SaA2.13]
MKRMTMILVTAFLMTMCSNLRTGSNSTDKPKKQPDVQYRDDFKSASDTELKALLKNLKAEAANYSVLILTQNYKGEKIIISNSKRELYSDYPISNLKTGIAQKLRIDNTLDTKVYDNFTKSETVIEAEEAKKHKYIYVMKNPGNKNPFTITYSNTLRPLE